MVESSEPTEIEGQLYLKQRIVYLKRNHISTEHVWTIFLIIAPQAM
jgi:hypothetical protein